MKQMSSSKPVRERCVQMRLVSLSWYVAYV